MPEDNPGKKRPFQNMGQALTDLLLSQKLGNEAKVSFGDNQAFIVSFQQDEVSGDLVIWLRGMPPGKEQAILGKLPAVDMGGGDFAINLSALASQRKPPPGSIWVPPTSRTP